MKDSHINIGLKSLMTKLSVLLLVLTIIFTTLSGAIVALATGTQLLGGTENSAVIDLDFKSDGTITANSSLGTIAVKEYDKMGNTANTPYKGVGNNIVKIGSDYYSVNAVKSLADTGLVEIDTSPYKAALISELSDGFSVEVGFVIPSAPSKREGYIFGGTSGGGFGLRMSKAGELQFVLRGNGSSYEVLSLGNPSMNEYHHVVATFDADAGTLSIYLDGALKVSKTGVTKFTPGSWNGKIMLFDTSSTSKSYQYALPKDTVVTDFHIYADALSAAESAAKYSEAVGAMTPYTKKDILELEFTDDSVKVVESELGEVSVKEYSDRDTALTDFPSVSNQIIKVNGKKYTVNAFKAATASSFLQADTGEYSSKLIAELQDGFSIETGFVIPAGIDVTRDRYIVGATCGGGLGIRIAKTTGNLEFVIHTGSVYKTVSVERPADGVYHHVVANYNADTDTMTMYVDGVLAGTTTDVTTVNKGSWNGNFNLSDTTSSKTSYTYALPSGSIITDLHIYSDVLSDTQSKDAYTAAINAMTPYTKVYDDDFEPVIRFMVTSDIHIGSSSSDTVRASKFAEELIAAYSIADTSGNHYEALDLIAIAGDLAEKGTVAQWQEGKKVADTYIDYNNTELLVITGNHEYYDDVSQAISSFEGVFGEGSANTARKVNGYWFIGVSSSSNGLGYTQDDVKFVEDALKTAAADDPSGTKPIFVFQHIGNVNTVFGTDSKAQYAGIDSFDSLYSKYPQVVCFAGHTHKPINDEASIYQDKYTSLSTGTLYFSIMSTVDNVAPTVVGGSVYDVSQFYIVEVDANNRTRIRIYDFEQDKFVGETYLLESYDPEDFVYNEERFEDKEIFFDEDAKINITETTENLVVFEFSPVDAESFTARNYKIVVEDMQGKEVVSKYIGWIYYEEDYETMLSSAIAGLEGDTEYTLKIYGVNAMYLEGITSEAKISETPLTTTFKTAKSVDTAVADLMDIKIDSSTDSVTDVSGNDVTLTVWGTPKTGHDDTIGMDYVSFDGNSNIKVSDFLNDKDDLIYGFTLEAYFKVDDFTNCSSYHRGVLAMEQSGGFGFDIYNDHTATFQVYTNGYKTVTKTLDEGKYYHWVCVYNGEELTCYINGNKMSSVKTDTPITFISDSAMKMFLGGDTTETGGWERLSNTSIAIARLYSEPMSEKQATELWEAVRALQDPDLYPDDSDDPEYLRWEIVDDDQTEYITFYDTKGNVHDHAIDENSFDVYPMYNGNVSYFVGSHYYNGSAHVLDGTVRAKLSFTGTAFRYVVRFRGPASDGYGDSVDVYIDGEYYTTVSGLNANNLTSRIVALEVIGLADKNHEITFISGNGMRVLFDEFQVVLGEGVDDDGKEIKQVPVDEYYVKNSISKTSKAPSIDGVISEDEWGSPVIVSNCTFASETWKDGFWAFDSSSMNVRQTAKVYITSDENYLYIGATLDKCQLDTTCKNASELYKAAHFNFTVSNWNSSTTVERIPFEGDDYEQYTGFMFGLVNGKKASFTYTQGLLAWELPADYYEIKYDEATNTYTYEAKIPLEKTNIVSDKMAFSASIGCPYTSGDAANRYNFTSGASTCGGAYNWAHLNNALAISLSGNPKTSDGFTATAAIIAISVLALGISAICVMKKRKNC